MAVPMLFTIPNFKTAGSGMEMVQILSRIDTKTFEPWIGVNEAGGALYEQLQDCGYRIIERAFSSPESAPMGRRLQEAQALSKFLKGEKIKLWQSFHWSSDFSEVLAARLANIPYVYTKKNMNWGRKAWKIKSWLASAIIARNRDMCDRFFSSSLYRNKVFLISGGVEAPAVGRRPQGYFRRLFDRPDRPLLVCLAQIVRSKDQATLIQAVSELEGVNLILAGAHRDPEYSQQLRNLLIANRMEDRVWMEGAVSEVGDLLSDADLFVLPTGLYGGHEEGCPVALMEALSLGLPSLGSSVAGIRDLIHPPETGWLFQPHNVADLRRKIQEILADKEEARQRGLRGQERMRANHRLEDEARAFEQVYRRLLP